MYGLYHDKNTNQWFLQKPKYDPPFCQSQKEMIEHEVFASISTDDIVRVQGYESKGNFEHLIQHMAMNYARQDGTLYGLFPTRKGKYIIYRSKPDGFTYKPHDTIHNRQDYHAMIDTYTNTLILKQMKVNYTSIADLIRYLDYIPNRFRSKHR